MRRIVMFNRITADGYFAAPDGSLDWIVPDPDFDRSAAQGIDRGFADTILFGRRTYELFERFWPHALDETETSPDPHQAQRRSPEMRAMAVMLNESAKFVFSKTLKTVTWRNSSLIRTFDPRQIEAMKRQPGRDILVFGSGTIVSQLTEHGLIDEYQLLVNPVFLGDGRSLIHGPASTAPLNLDGVMCYPSGNVLLRYCRGRLQ